MMNKSIQSSQSGEVLQEDAGTGAKAMREVCSPKLSLVALELPLGMEHRIIRARQERQCGRATDYKIG